MRSRHPILLGFVFFFKNKFIVPLCLLKPLCITILIGETEIFIFMLMFYYRNWLTQVWRLRNPMFWHLQTVNKEKQIQSRTETWKPGRQEEVCLSSTKSKYTLSSAFFVQSKPWMDWVIPIHIGEGDLYLVYRFTC